MGQLPAGFIGIPWFQLKTMLSSKFEQGSKGKSSTLPRAKAKQQDKKFLNEISKEKEYLEVYL